MHAQEPPAAAPAAPTAKTTRSAAAPAQRANGGRGGAIDGSPAARNDPLGATLARAVRERAAASGDPPLRPARARLPYAVLARVKFPNGSASFDVSPYDVVDSDNNHDSARQVGLDIGVSYSPDASLRTSKIGFVQVMKTQKDGSAYLFANERDRATDASSGSEGWVIDHLKGKKSPVYGQNDDGSTGSTTSFGWSTWYWSKAATMKDAVRLNRAVGQSVEVDAVTYAFDETNSTYLGGVSWGFKTSSAGKTESKAPALHASGNPAGVQKAALQKWNEQAALTDVAKRNAPTQANVVVPP